MVELVEQTNAINTNGSFAKLNGTSFAAPVMCGMVVCLWQAYPKLTNKQLLTVVRNSGLEYNPVKPQLGFGRVSINKAIKQAEVMMKN